MRLILLLMIFLGIGVRADQGFDDKSNRIVGNIRKQVSYVKEAKTQWQAKVDDLRVRHAGGVDFLFQGGMIAARAREIRGDWFDYVRGALVRGEDLLGKEELVRLYCAYLQSRYERAREDRDAILRRLDEADKRFSYAQSLVLYAKDMIEALESISAQSLLEERKDLFLDEPDSRYGEGPAIFERDAERARRDYMNAVADLRSRSAESKSIARELDEISGLIFAAKREARVLPVAWSEALYRPSGLPLIDARGRLLGVAEWRALSEAPAPDKKELSWWGNFKKSCVQIVAG